ncbi:hypothetical protein Tco_0728635 [Tanacetum coccineum]|uniref:Reverse transcriptase Ty1/copia-type domain-containing protein n=1 Tax=Tanacetum coccineum TaxID=301880 RepID=A0ABQ4YLN2_9ASTR
MGLWYSKDTGMSLIAYADADHAWCQDTRRSTSGSAQFLCDKLVSWSSKKKKSIAISSTEAEYIALSGVVLKSYGAKACDFCASQSASLYSMSKALDDALVAPADHLEFGKCNMRLKTDIKPKEATFQVVLDALALTPFYQAFMITADVPAIYMQEFWATICPKILGQKFEDLPLEQDILSFIKDLGHTGDIIYLTDVYVDYLHQPWRSHCGTVFKVLSGKETGMDKIRLSHDQILWGLKITQVYGIILPKELTNQGMLESNAYKTYYAFTSGEKTPNLKVRLKSKAKLAEPDKKNQPAKKPKAKGLAILSEVSLTEAE